MLVSPPLVVTVTFSQDGQMVAVAGARRGNCTQSPAAADRCSCKSSCFSRWFSPVRLSQHRFRIPQSTSVCFNFVLEDLHNTRSQVQSMHVLEMPKK